MAERCTCDHHTMRRNPSTGKCEACGLFYSQCLVCGNGKRANEVLCSECNLKEALDIRITIVLPASVPDDRVVEHSNALVIAMSDLHVAYGGSGLRVDGCDVGKGVDKTRVDLFLVPNTKDEVSDGDE